MGKANEDSHAAASYKAPTPQPVVKPTITVRGAVACRGDLGRIVAGEHLLEIQHEVGDICRHHFITAVVAGS